MVVLTVTQKMPSTKYGLTIITKVSLILEEAPIQKVDLAPTKISLVIQILMLIQGVVSLTSYTKIVVVGWITHRYTL